MSDYRLSDLLDLTIIQKMADAHYLAAGMPIGIIDAIDGSILVGSGWQDICVKFHRANPVSLQRCRESDNYIKGRLVEGEACHYKCKNGLWDIGMPIVVAGRHLATMFLGQFFYKGEAPDREYFIQLAHQFGFDVDDYLAALDRVPVFSREKVGYILDYDKALVSFIADLAEHALLKIKADEIIRKREREFHAIFDQAYQFLWLLSIDGRVLEANRTALRFGGVEEADVIGKPFWETAWWAQSSELQEQVRQAVQKAAKGEFVRFEANHPAADGNLHYVDFSLKPVTDEAGRVVLLIPEGQDITERKRAEERLKNQMEFVTTLLDTIPSPIFYKDTSGRYLGCNRAFEEFQGKPRESIMGKSVHDMAPTEIAKKYEVMDRELFEQGGHQTYEWKVRAADGSDKDVIFNKATFPDARGKTAGLVGVILDITERKRAESLICDSEEKFRTLVENLNVGVYRSTGDLHGRFIQANTAMIKMFGYDSLDEFMKISVSDLYKDSEERRLLIEEIRRYGYVKDKELALWKKDGSLMWGSISTTAQIDEDGEIKWMDGVVEDITERKKAEVALRESEQRLKIILHGSPIATFVIGRDHRIIHWNDALEQLSGIKAGTIIGTKDQWKAFYDKERPCLADLIIDDSLKALPDWYLSKYTKSKLIDEAYEATDFFPSLGDKGKWLRFTAAAIRNAVGDCIGAIETLEDITDTIISEKERKRLETQLAQAQKMEAIGTLAGGIAHDFNNILSAIIGYTELSMDDITDPVRARGELREVLKAGDRAKDLVGQILTFSRKTETAYSPIALRTIVKESLKMLRSVIPTTIEIRQDLADSGLVMSNSTQINQIIMNLSTNAAHAMDEEGGVLEVSLKRVDLDQETADGLDVTSGTYLKLTVSDTGHGMPPEVMERIFEPYFTTKDLGSGTGLGLSVVHGIVKSHGGAIICRSVPKEGTTFEVYLPEIESEKKEAGPSEKEPIPTGTERILFIDDEAALAGLAEKMLSKMGYTVVIKSSSSEALELFQKDADKYDLVITDMTMPGMTGDRLAKKFIEIRHDIPVILCSGYSEHISEDKAKKMGIREFVMKPLEMNELARTIRKVLDGE